MVESAPVVGAGAGTAGAAVPDERGSFSSDGTVPGVELVIMIEVLGDEPIGAVTIVGGTNGAGAAPPDAPPVDVVVGCWPGGNGVVAVSAGEAGVVFTSDLVSGAG